MTQQQAIAWAINKLAYGLQHQYFVYRNSADKAAKAMTILSGEDWVVHVIDEKGHNTGKYWVMTR